MEFVAIDVETANTNRASICQIGIARYHNGELAEEWSSLIDPEDHFDAVNTGIHGISARDVADKPTFPQIADRLAVFLNGSICISHTPFDRVAIDRVLEKYGLPLFDTTWLDSARVTRRAWPELSRSGYGLANVCEKLGYSFTHHDALEDAKACGYVFLAAIEQTGLGVTQWLQRIEQPIESKKSTTGQAIKTEPNPGGELYGEVLVFTGSLDMPRREAANLAASLGCVVAPHVTRKTTILVVGDQGTRKRAGKEKSSKHMRAEQLISKGQNIRILNESDFQYIMNNNRTDGKCALILTS